MEVRQVAAAYGAKPLEPVVKNGTKAAPGKTAAAQKEQVEFSDASISMQKMKDIIDATPEVRIKIVEEIRMKIKYNGYPIESNFYKAMENLISNKIV
ncbi:MAG: hypothetical protein JXA18_10210 [Chitinispirillaceae bacterium]|nr:hypothetical protein [Chitinispirillaceae bacterium]